LASPGVGLRNVTGHVQLPGVQCRRDEESRAPFGARQAGRRAAPWVGDGRGAVRDVPRPARGAAARAVAAGGDLERPASRGRSAALGTSCRSGSLQENGPRSEEASARPYRPSQARSRCPRRSFSAQKAARNDLGSPGPANLAQLERRLVQLEQTLAEVTAEREALRAENERLRREVEAWRRGWRERGKRRSSRPEKKRAAERKRPGRKGGHVGVRRAPPARVDRAREHPMPTCGPGCGADVAATAEEATALELDVGKLPERLAAHRTGLETFLTRPDVPPTNNATERDLRADARHRAMTGGTRSRQGSEVLAHGLTVTQTRRKNGLPLGSFVQGVVAAHLSGTPPPSVLTDEASELGRCVRRDHGRRCISPLNSYRASPIRLPIAPHRVGTFVANLAANDDAGPSATRVLASSPTRKAASTMSKHRLKPTPMAPCSSGPNATPPALARGRRGRVTTRHARSAPAPAHHAR
jgi:hypothetical protein